MSFNLKAFEKTKYAPREGEVKLPSLSHYFGEGEEPVFKVRGLDSVEIHRARDQASRGKLMSEVVAKLAGGTEREKAEAVLEALGVTADDPQSLVIKYANVEAGVVEPKLERYHVVKLAKAHPIEFGMLERKIMELTGLGHAAEVKH